MDDFCYHWPCELCSAEYRDGKNHEDPDRHDEFLKPMARNGPLPPVMAHRPEFVIHLIQRPSGDLVCATSASYGMISYVFVLLAS